MPKVLIHKGFLESLGDLSPSEQDQVRSTVFMLMDDVRGKGLRAHKVGEFWSYSPSMDLRVMAWQGGSNITLLHVNHHDKAYRWGERTRAVTNDAGQVLTLTAIQDHVDQSGSSMGITDAVKHVAEGYLLMGFPAPVARLLASVTDEGEWLEVVGQFAPSAQNKALAVRCGIHASDTIGLPSDIVLLRDEEAMRFALKLPTELWRVFLHPQQRFAVDIPVDRHVLLRGGPGVGKSVTLIHRFVKIAQSNAKPPALLALNQPVRRVLQESLEVLGCGEMISSVITVDDFPKGKSALAAYLQRYSSLLVDEGQDLPRGFLAMLLANLTTDPHSVPPLFIAYDANQALSSPSGDALERLTKICDLVRLTYSYRCTHQNAEASLNLLSSLHTHFIGRDFKSSHEISASKDHVSSSYVSATSGPRIVFKTFSNSHDLHVSAVNVLAGFDRFYSHKCTKAIIFVSEDSEVGATRGSIETELTARGINAEVLTPIEAKGREFFAGVVVDGLDYSSHYSTESDGAIPITKARYRQLAGLYVGLSRFRDRAVCFALSTNSPLNHLEVTNGKQ